MRIIDNLKSMDEVALAKWLLNLDCWESCILCPADKYCSHIGIANQCEETLEKWLKSEFMEIKPCPFCGGSYPDYLNLKHDSVHSNGSINTVVITYVRCDACGVSGPVVLGVDEDAKTKAITFWNEREKLED